MMFAISQKPVVLKWANPRAKVGLTLKQNKTKQKGWVFECLHSIQKPTTLLVALIHKQGFLSWFFFLGALRKSICAYRQNTVLHKFSTKFYTITKKRWNMGTYDPHYTGNVETQLCPFCGEARLLDWFGRRVLKINVHSARTHALVRTIRYRKFAACWKCREFNRALRFAADPYALVPEQYRTPAYTIAVQKDSNADEGTVSEDDLLIG